MKYVKKNLKICYNTFDYGHTKGVMKMNNMMSVEEFDSKIKRVIITEEQIREATKKLGKEISDSYDGRPILLVSILKGAFVFMADLCREITVPCEIGFMCAKSYYSGTVSTGAVKITMDLDQDISKYHVIIVEDIIDTGRTLKDVVNLLKTRNPISLKVVTLLDKPSRRVTDFEADTVLFTIPDHFVIGYGLDCGEYFRNLPYIAEYNQEA
jgi:hypoxanthine phosphoribosyltransferase